MKELSHLQKYDNDDMRSMILDFPHQFQKGIDAAHAALLPEKKIAVDRILIAGMGGSALPGELLKLLAAQSNVFKSPIDLHIHRGYNLPASVDAKTLVVCISYSGNTEETISAYKEARKKNLPLAVIASGGELEKLAHSTCSGQAAAKPMFIKIPEANIPPRLAVGMQFAALLALLERLGLISPQTPALQKAAGALRPAALEQTAKTIAKKTFLRIPVVYASRRNKALAYIMKIGFNENAKMMAFWNYIPECNHNEIVGFSGTHKEFMLFFLNDNSDSPPVKKRMRIMEQLAKKNRLSTQVLDITNSKVYNKIFTTILLSNWISYYCALFHGIDPAPVQIVEEFKKKMRA